MHRDGGSTTGVCACIAWIAPGEGVTGFERDDLAKPLVVLRRPLRTSLYMLCPGCAAEVAPPDHATQAAKMSPVAPSTVPRIITGPRFFIAGADMLPQMVTLRSGVHAASQKDDDRRPLQRDQFRR